MSPKHPLRSKTVQFGLLLITMALLELLQVHLPAMLVDVAPKTNAWIMFGVGAIVLVLRFVTKGPIAWRTDAPEIADADE